MITERMVELWLLREALKELPKEVLGQDSVVTDDNKKVNIKKMFDRLTELQSEFIAPYVID